MTLLSLVNKPTCYMSCTCIFYQCACVRWKGAKNRAESFLSFPLLPSCLYMGNSRFGSQDYRLLCDHVPVHYFVHNCYTIHKGKVPVVHCTCTCMYQYMCVYKVCMYNIHVHVQNVHVRVYTCLLRSFALLHLDLQGRFELGQLRCLGTYMITHM